MGLGLGFGWRGVAYGGGECTPKAIARDETVTRHNEAEVGACG